MPKAATREAQNHLRAWRLFRHLSQEQLAEIVGTTGNVISLLESGDRGLSDKWLRRLAPALSTRPGFLLEFDPNSVELNFLQAASEIPPENRDQAIVILKTFTRR
jgi:transcriptional regulator with XRE-family HTH domain